MGKEYVGIDLHRRRSVIYRMDEAGEKIDCVRINNDPVWFAQEVSKAPKGSDVVIEATYGWYWAVDLLQEHRLRGPPVQSPRQRLGTPAGEERRAGRPGPGRPVAARSAGRGLDRPAADAGAPRAGPIPATSCPTCAPASRPRPTR